MAYGDIEESIDNATPYELFEFSYFANTWLYTNSDKNVFYEGREYEAVPVKHDSIEQSIVADKASLVITLPFDVEFSEIFRIQPPSELVHGKIICFNSAALTNYAVLWQGRILSCEWKYPWCEFNCENVFSSLNRTGLRRRYSPMCPFALYGNDCKAGRTNVRYNTRVETVNISEFTTVLDGSTLTDGWFDGGSVEWTNPYRLNTERLMILSFTAATRRFAVASPTVNLTPGQNVIIYPGCNHSIDHCASKFNNQLNFGATPYIPTKNPFAGSIMY